jgi:hypothetical protein
MSNMLSAGRFKRTHALHPPQGNTVWLYTYVMSSTPAVAGRP